MVQVIKGKLKEILQDGLDELRKSYGNKIDARAILGYDSLKAAFARAKEHLSGLAGAVADTFKPHLDTLKNVS